MNAYTFVSNDITWRQQQQFYQKLIRYDVTKMVRLIASLLILFLWLWDRLEHSSMLAVMMWNGTSNANNASLVA